MADEIPLNLRQLQYFTVTAESGSITRAAERLRISQPSLSHQLRTLEGRVGAVLFDRKARGVALTPVGAAPTRAAPPPRPAARPARQGAGDARRPPRAPAALERGELRIATSLS